MKYSDLAQIGKRRLSKAAIQCADPLLHMKQILEHVMRIDSARLALRWNEEITDPAVEPAVEAILARREKGEPFQYILGEEWFWQSRFEVGPGVFIPRKETELLVEAILQRCGEKFTKVCELGPGSGNIGLTVLQERPSWEWHAFEKNKKTLPYLEKNRASLLAPAVVYRVHATDFFDGAVDHAPYDGLATNPPYVRGDELDRVPTEVKHEPIEALDGGAEGLDVIFRLIESAPRLLRAGAWFVSEIDFRQADAVRDKLVAGGFGDVEIIDDYSHRPRVVFARRRKQ